MAETMTKNDLFQNINTLAQELFFDATKTGPTKHNPLRSPKWDTYIEQTDLLNKQLAVTEKIVTVVVTSCPKYIEGEGSKTFYYHKVIKASEDYDQCMNEAQQNDHNVIRIVPLKID